MSIGLDNLKHLVVLMMENRSFDHMLGGLKAVNPNIDGLTGNESNPDTTGATVKVQASADYQGQLDPDPNHDFDTVDQQIFNGGTASMMQGFIASYYQQQQNVQQSRKILLLCAGEAADPDHPGARVRGLQSVVRVNPGPDPVQSRLRALRDVVRQCGHEPVLCQHDLQEHLLAGHRRRQERQALLL